MTSLPSSTNSAPSGATATDNQSGALPISACIITYNEEQRIRDCLESVRFCQEIIVIDSHSDDATRDIAAEYQARVIERDWPGHIDQKNFAIDQANNDWVLCIDADERVTPELKDAIDDIFNNGPKADGFYIHRRTYYLGQFIDYGGFYPDRKMRLFRRSKGRWGGTNPHDHVFLEQGCQSGRLPYDLHHYSYRDIADHLKTIDYFTTIAAKEKLAKNKGSRLFLGIQMLFAPIWKFLKMYIVQRGFLDGRAGFVVAMLGAFYAFLKYAKLWELKFVKGEQASDTKVTYGRKGDT